MTKSHDVKNDSVEACPSFDGGNSSSHDPTIHVIRVIDIFFSWPSFFVLSQGEFDWSPQTQGLILGSFFYGYVLTQVIGGENAPLHPD